MKNIKTKFKYLPVFNLIYSFSIWWNENGILAIYNNEKLLKLDPISALQILNSIQLVQKLNIMKIFGGQLEILKTLEW